MLSAIPEATRRRNGFDFFPETVACSHGGIGYIVRTFPQSFDPYGGNTLAPLFALTSRGPRGEPPLLVELIRQSRRSPEAYLVSKVIEPYVRALAYLLFEEGLQVEGHTQNICYELDTEGSLTGKVVLRDLSGTTVNPALRLARGRRMPSLARTGLSAVMGPIHRRSPSYAVEMSGCGTQSGSSAKPSRGISQSSIDGTSDRHTCCSISERRSMPCS